MLEAVASGAATRANEVELYVKSLLAAASGSVDKEQQLFKAAKEALMGLAKPLDLVQWDQGKEAFVATNKGKAVMASGLSPEEALTMMVSNLLIFE